MEKAIKNFNLSCCSPLNTKMQPPESALAAVQQFGLFQFAARGKVSVIQCSTFAKLFTRASSKARLLKNTRNYLSKKKNIFSEQRAQSATSLGRLKSQNGFPLSWSIYELRFNLCVQSRGVGYHRQLSAIIK